MRFLQDLNEYMPAENELALWWMGQAGFLIKTRHGTRILIDPYFSDYVNRKFREEQGQVYKRMTPMWVDPVDIRPDIFLGSHEHEDHLDIDSLDRILTDETRAFINSASIEVLQNNGFSSDRFTVMKKGEELDFGEFHLTVIDSNHGDGCQEALGFYLDFGFTSVYFAGDTCLDPVRLSAAIERRPEVALLPINGAYGNLNAIEAARLAALLRAKSCIPCHFWTFPEHDTPQGSPIVALRIFPEEAPGCRLVLATPGEMLLVSGGGTIREAHVEGGAKK